MDSRDLYLFNDIFADAFVLDIDIGNIKESICMLVSADHVYDEGTGYNKYLIHFTAPRSFCVTGIPFVEDPVHVCGFRYSEVKQQDDLIYIQLGSPSDDPSALLIMIKIVCKSVRITPIGMKEFSSVAPNWHTPDNTSAIRPRLEDMVQPKRRPGW
ncbi:MAG: hypothetical protein RIB58_12555 [Phycisphaerales bacterium]